MYKASIIIDRLTFDMVSGKFYTDIDNMKVLKYYKGLYRSKAKFKENFIDRIQPHLFDNECYAKTHKMLNTFMDSFDKTEPFTYAEAFKLENRELQAMVFGTINIGEMIKNLGAVRIKADGIPVKRKIFAKNGEPMGYKEYDNIYETYEVDGKGLGLDSKLYAIKCWCTSTNKEHYLWINEEHKNNPLEAIASTFMIHSNLIPFIKELKRQGDVLLVELTKDVNPEGEIVSLTKEQYFSLLTAES
jgi:hypothetical protein